MKKRITIFFFILINVAQISANAVYVSSSCGDDSNNGQSIEQPVKSIQKANAISADTLYLKAGDVFYESLGQIKNMVVTRYGIGKNPELCGLKYIASLNWVHVSGNIWRINLSADNYWGAGEKGSSIQNNIGCIYDYSADLIHGRKVQYRSELTEDWDMWQTERFDRGVPASEFDYLYLFLRQDPNQMKLSFSTYDHVVTLKNATVDGIDMKGFGFGISARSNSVIRNCCLDIIGGRTQIGYPSFVCYGNGIEFYVLEDIENCIVEHNIISRCYDCGVTIQGSNMGAATPRNIIVRDNFISQCCQGWEDFLRNDPDVVYDNCVVENNIVVNSGESGWGYPASRFKYCHVLGNNKDGNRGMIIRNNTFAGGNYY